MNRVHFARAGCVVELCDISPNAIRLCLEHASELGVSVKLAVADVRGGELPQDSYGLIILLCVLHFVSAKDGPSVIPKCSAAVKLRGPVYISTFGVHEQLYRDLIREATISDSVQSLDETTFK